MQAVIGVDLLVQQLVKMYRIESKHFCYLFSILSFLDMFAECLSGAIFFPKENEQLKATPYSGKILGHTHSLFHSMTNNFVPASPRFSQVLRWTGGVCIIFVQNLFDYDLWAAVSLVIVNHWLNSIMASDKVFLWSAPRCLSTAFERSIRELDNTFVHHSPYRYAFFLGPQHQTELYVEDKEKDMIENYTYEKITKSLTENCSGFDLVFVKEIAFFLDNHHHVLLDDEMKTFKHTFLIRNPIKSVSSYYWRIKEREQNGLKKYFAYSAGHQSLYDLYQFVVKELDKDPIIIDADDLIDNPKGMMEAYCKAVGINFDEKILTWEPKEIADWKSCADWHVAASQSSGFFKSSETAGIGKYKLDQLPDEIIQTIERNMPLYNELFEKRLRLENTDIPTEANVY